MDSALLPLFFILYSSFIILCVTDMRLALPAIFATIICFLLVGQRVISVAQIEAFTMSNTNWIIDFANLNMTSGKGTSTNYRVSNTVGQIAPGLYTGTNYKVRAGFQYVYSIIPFRFSITGLAIDFGSLTPTNPVTRTNTLTLTNGSANGYVVTAYENHGLLKQGTGSIIPDTTCDSGLCTDSTSAAWTNTLTYGFGYRCDNVSGSDCATGFTTSTFYKQFTNTTYVSSTSGQAVMRGTNVGRNKQVTITYKVNVSGTQPPEITLT